MYPFSVDLSQCTKITTTKNGEVWKEPSGSLIALDFKGRPLVPEKDQERFWAMDTQAKVGYLFDMLEKGTADGIKASGGWVAERLACLGLITTPELLFEAKMVLQGAGWGLPISDLRAELRTLGVQV